MQINTLDNAQELAGFLEQSEILYTVQHGATRMYVATFDSQDLLVFAGNDGKATVIYPPESFDDESGGSVHDHARAIAENAA